MLPVIYGELCPQCGGDLSWFEIEKNFCEKKRKSCITHPYPGNIKNLRNFLKRR